MDANGSLRQANAFAMQHGLLLGAVLVVAFAAFVGSFAVSALSTLFLLLALAFPVLAVWQTLRFRETVTGKSGPFSFWHGTGHTLLSVLYASVWLAFGVYLYFGWLDRGFFFDSYLEMLRRPEVQAALADNALLREMPGGGGVAGAEELVEALRGVGAAGYAALSIYMCLLAGVPLSVVAGLVACRRFRKSR